MIGPYEKQYSIEKETTSPAFLPSLTVNFSINQRIAAQMSKTADARSNWLRWVSSAFRE
ncbi:MAG: hypothetical protein KKG33_12095 [candidate division Zixibacteria bacterium]|nr:hypothetical protein [candidate division Zixibacteria bacterium]